VVTVCFNPDQITEQRIIGFVEELGFSVTRSTKS
jgi:hypothetical protein